VGNEAEAEVCLSVSPVARREGCISMQNQLAEAWGGFLSRYRWDWFLTLTFREPVVSFRAHRLFSYFARDIEKAVEIPIAWFRGDELGWRGGRLHFHSLMLNVAHLRRLSWMDQWERRAGFARILPFDRQKGAAFYCAKYVTKQFGDWEISDNLTAFSHYQEPMFRGKGMKKDGNEG